MKLLKLFSLLLLLAFSACNDDDSDELNRIQSPLLGIWEGNSFTVFLVDGFTEGELTGTLTFNDDGKFNSSLSPFSLNTSSGSWDYNEDDKQIIFNQQSEEEEIAEHVALSDDSLQFTIYRGEPTNQTTIIFKLSR